MLLYETSVFNIQPLLYPDGDMQNVLEWAGISFYAAQDIQDYVDNDKLEND